MASASTAGAVFFTGTLAPVGAVFFNCFPDMPRASSNSDLTGGPRSVAEVHPIRSHWRLVANVWHEFASPLLTSGVDRGLDAVGDVARNHIDDRPRVDFREVCPNVKLIGRGRAWHVEAKRRDLDHAPTCTLNFALPLSMGGERLVLNALRTSLQHLPPQPSPRRMAVNIETRRLVGPNLNAAASVKG
jgi:hypothetical protein